MAEQAASVILLMAPADEPTKPAAASPSPSPSLSSTPTRLHGGADCSISTSTSSEDEEGAPAPDGTAPVPRGRRRRLPSASQGHRDDGCTPPLRPAQRPKVMAAPAAAAAAAPEQAFFSGLGALSLTKRPASSFAATTSFTGLDALWRPVHAHAAGGDGAGLRASLRADPTAAVSLNAFGEVPLLLAARRGWVGGVRLLLGAMATGLCPDEEEDDEEVAVAEVRGWAAGIDDELRRAALEEACLRGHVGAARLLLLPDRDVLPLPPLVGAGPEDGDEPAASECGSSYAGSDDEGGEEEEEEGPFGMVQVAVQQLLPTRRRWPREGWSLLMKVAGHSGGGAAGGAGRWGKQEQAPLIPSLPPPAPTPAGELGPVGPCPVLALLLDALHGPLRRLSPLTPAWCAEATWVEEVLDEQDCDGWTALANAAYQGGVGAVRLLLQAGADPLVEGEDGLTALDRAKARGHAACVELLEGWCSLHRLLRLQAGTIKEQGSTPPPGNLLLSYWLPAAAAPSSIDPPQQPPLSRPGMEEAGEKQRGARTRDACTSMDVVSVDGITDSESSAVLTAPLKMTMTGGVHALMRTPRLPAAAFARLVRLAGCFEGTS